MKIVKVVKVVKMVKVVKVLHKKNMSELYGGVRDLGYQVFPKCWHCHNWGHYTTTWSWYHHLLSPSPSPSTSPSPSCITITQFVSVWKFLYLSSECLCLERSGKHTLTISTLEPQCPLGRVMLQDSICKL